MAPETKQTRDGSLIKFIAYMQIIGIVLVVLGHSFHEYPDGDHGMSTLLYRMMYSFRMPTFMFVSGFLMVYTTHIRRDNPPGVGDFCRSKVKRLLLPFLVLSLVTFVPRAMMTGMADDDLSMSFGSLCRSLLYSGDMVIPYFWFLQASFILLTVNYYIIYFAEKRGVTRWKTYSVLLAIALLLPASSFSDFFSVNSAVRLSVYFILGSAYSHYSARVDRFIKWDSIWMLLACGAVWSVSFLLFEGSGWMMICSIAGICMCMSLARILESRHIGVLDHLIGANYIIFLLSWYFNVATQQVLGAFVSLPWWIHTLMSLTAGIYVPYLFYRYMQSHPDSRAVRISAYLLGQSLRNKRPENRSGVCIAAGK